MSEKSRAIDSSQIVNYHHDPAEILLVLGALNLAVSYPKNTRR